MSSLEISSAIKEIYEEQRFGMLISRQGLYPYPSMVAFAFSSDLSEIIFATSATSHKYNNIGKLPHVSFVVHDCKNEPSDISNASVVTAFGIAEIMNGSGVQGLLKDLLMSRHPNLKTFFEARVTKFIIIHVEKYQVVTNFENIAEVTIQ